MKKTKFILLSLAVTGLTLGIACTQSTPEEVVQKELEEKELAIREADKEIKKAEAELLELRERVKQAKEEGDIEKANALKKEMEEDIRRLKQKILETEDKIREAASIKSAGFEKESEASRKKLSDDAPRLKESNQD